jgi:hypothetical protein
MPQNNNNNKITNTFKNRYTYLSFVDRELKKLIILKKGEIYCKTAHIEILVYDIEIITENINV